MKELIKLLDKSFLLQRDISHYALPPETSYDSYEEAYREYKVVRKIFTVLIRKTNDEYWVRCGYKNSLESKTVEGFSGRDITSKHLSVIMKHCCDNILKVCDSLDQ